MAECGKKGTCKNYDKKCSQCWANSSIYDTHPCYTSKDLVEVVRCKDCKYLFDYSPDEKPFCELFADGYDHQFRPNPEDYCSRGQLRTPKQIAGEKAKYKIEIWRHHSIVETHESEEITEILKWYKENWQDYHESCECAFYIYKNNKEMNIEEITEFGFFD